MSTFQMLWVKNSGFPSIFTAFWTTRFDPKSKELLCFEFKMKVNSFYSSRNSRLREKFVAGNFEPKIEPKYGENTCSQSKYSQ